MSSTAEIRPARGQIPFRLARIVRKLERRYPPAAYGLGPAIEHGALKWEGSQLLLDPRGAKFFDCEVSAAATHEELTRAGLPHRCYLFHLTQGHSFLNHWMIIAQEDDREFAVSFTPYDRMMGINSYAPLDQVGGFLFSNPFSADGRFKSTPLTLGEHGARQFFPLRAREQPGNQWIITDGGITRQGKFLTTYVFYLQIAWLFFSPDGKRFEEKERLFLEFSVWRSLLRGTQERLAGKEDFFRFCEVQKTSGGNQLEGVARQDAKMLRTMVLKMPG